MYQSGGCGLITALIELVRQLVEGIPHNLGAAFQRVTLILQCAALYERFAVSITYFPPLSSVTMQYFISMLCLLFGMLDDFGNFFPFFSMTLLYITLDTLLSER